MTDSVNKARILELTPRATQRKARYGVTVTLTKQGRSNVTGALPGFVTIRTDEQPIPDLNEFSTTADPETATVAGRTKGAMKCRGCGKR